MSLGILLKYSLAQQVEWGLRFSAFLTVLLVLLLLHTWYGKAEAVKAEPCLTGASRACGVWLEMVCLLSKLAFTGMGLRAWKLSLGPGIVLEVGQGSSGVFVAWFWLNQ